MKTLKVDIWSDVRCPFCYIGKHKFEKALRQFVHQEQVEVVWHSFELDPILETNIEVNALEYLAKNKGISKIQAEQMLQFAVEAAKEEGLLFDFNRSIVANSFNAHRLIQLGKVNKKDAEIEEALFKAHFSNGKNIDDKEVLVNIGTSIGMDKEEVEEALISEEYAQKVKQDEVDAQSLGIRGVPYFVFDNKYAVSGAQATEVFQDALQQSWKEFEESNRPQILNEGTSCSIDGQCH